MSKWKFQSMVVGGKFVTESGIERHVDIINLVAEEIIVWVPVVSEEQVDKLVRWPEILFERGLQSGSSFEHTCFLDKAVWPVEGQTEEDWSYPYH